jgi:hypothetical protein
MERRSFLRGVFGGVTASGLILSASPKEIEAFAAPLEPKQPLVVDPVQAFTRQTIEIGEHLYNERGECVAVTTGFRYFRDIEELDHIPGHGRPRTVFVRSEEIFLDARVLAHSVEMEYRRNDLTRVRLRGKR